MVAFDSGHIGNVFQAKLLPESNDSVMVTCAADGQVMMPACPPPDRCALAC
jgi:hypothetical protein